MTKNANDPVAEANWPVPPVTLAVPMSKSAPVLAVEVDASKVSPAMVKTKATCKFDRPLFAGVLIETLAFPYGSTVPLPDRLMPLRRSPAPVTARFSEMEVVTDCDWP